jgi:anti-sigma factor RsiW
MKMHTEWTDKLSDYLDDELEAAERAAVEAHLRECADCSAVLDDLRRVIARAQAAATAARPPQTDLWTGVAGRINRIRQPRRVSLTVAQLAAAAVLVAAVSAGMAWQFAPSIAGRPDSESSAAITDRTVASSVAAPAGSSAGRRGRPDGVSVIGVSVPAITASGSPGESPSRWRNSRRRKLDLLRRATALTDMD